MGTANHVSALDVSPLELQRLTTPDDHEPQQEASPEDTSGDEDDSEESEED
jgi:hypothetical protein